MKIKRVQVKNISLLDICRIEVNSDGVNQENFWSVKFAVYWNNICLDSLTSSSPPPDHSIFISTPCCVASAAPHSAPYATTSPASGRPTRLANLPRADSSSILGGRHRRRPPRSSDLIFVKGNTDFKTCC